MQYVLPDAVENSSQGCPVVCVDTPQRALPAVSATWWRLGAQLAAPEPAQQLEADRTQIFALRVPGACEVALVPRPFSWLQQSSPELRSPRPPVSRCTGDAVDASNMDGAIMVPWNEDKDAFWIELEVPRADMLDVVSCQGPSSPWQQLLRFQVLPESQHLRERPDLIFEPPAPDKRDPTFSMVWFCCNLCRWCSAPQAVRCRRAYRSERS